LNVLIARELDARRDREPIRRAERRPVDPTYGLRLLYVMCCAEILNSIFRDLFVERQPNR
jgi:hypothetical protein